MIPLRDVNPRRGFPIIVIIIILFNLLVFLSYFDLPEERIEQIFNILGLVPARMSLLSLLTYQFLHGGIFHLISNMWALWIFGDNLEDRLGHLRFLIFYLLCGVMAGFIHTISLPESEIPCVGASGAISGVIGAYIILYPMAKILCFVPIFIFLYYTQMPAILFGGLWFILQLLNGLVIMASEEDVAGVAWWAHIGGFIGGIFLLRLFLKKEPPVSKSTDIMDV